MIAKQKAIFFLISFLSILVKFLYIGEYFYRTENDFSHRVYVSTNYPITRKTHKNGPLSETIKNFDVDWFEAENFTIIGSVNHSFGKILYEKLEEALTICKNISSCQGITRTDSDGSKFYSLRGSNLVKVKNGEKSWMKKNAVKLSDNKNLKGEFVVRAETP